MIQSLQIKNLLLKWEGWSDSVLQDVVFRFFPYAGKIQSSEKQFPSVSRHQDLVKVTKNVNLIIL